MAILRRGSFAIIILLFVTCKQKIENYSYTYNRFNLQGLDATKNKIHTSTLEMYEKDSDFKKLIKSGNLIKVEPNINGDSLNHKNHFLLSAANEFKDKTEFVHQMWQTDFTYFKIIGWEWYYLSTVLDDYSRYIIHWELCGSMKAEDVKRTVDTAIEKAKLK